MSFYLLIITFSSIISILLSSIFFSNSKSVLVFGLDNKEGTQKLHLIDSTRLGGLSIIISTYLLLIFEFDNPYFLIIFYFSWPIFLILMPYSFLNGMNEILLYILVPYFIKKERYD